MTFWVLGALFTASVEVPLEPWLASHCDACHSRAYVTQQRLTKAQWTSTLNKMKSWGAPMEDAQVASMARALSKRYGPSRAAPKFKKQQVR